MFEFTVPDFKGESLDKSVVLRYNFRSLVTRDVLDKELLLKSSQKPISNNKDTNGNGVSYLPSPQPVKREQSRTSAAPHDFLMGNFIIFFSFFILNRFHAEEFFFSTDRFHGAY